MGKSVRESDDFSYLLGEFVRMMRTYWKARKMDPETKLGLENLKKSARDGNTEDMYMLGKHYYFAEYIPYDPRETRYWWTKAAEGGHVEAQYSLGLLYSGDLTKMYRNSNLAGYWFDKAADNGHKEADRILREYYRYSELLGRWLEK